MLVLGAKNDTGHVVHVIVGPESELFMDVHGAVAVDVSQLLKAIGSGGKINLLVTRCRSEQATAKALEADGIPYIRGSGQTEPDRGTSLPDLDIILKHTPAAKGKDA